MKKLLLILLATISVSVFLLCGCQHSIIGSESTGNIDNNTKNGIDYTVIYYGVNDNKKITVNEKYNGAPEFMMSHLIARISEFCGVAIDFNSISDSGDGKTITVDFSKSGSPASGLSSGSESAVLDSITETIFANYPNVDNVCFTCDEGEYNSGHVFLEKGEAYRTREKDSNNEADQGPILGRPDFYEEETK